MRLLTSTTLLIACAGCGGTDEDVKVAPGSARLTFHRQDGTLLEEVELSVVEVGSLEVTVPGGGVGFLGLEPPEWPRLLMRGGTDTFFLRMNDAAGERLLGFGPVQYTAPANAEVLAALLASGCMSADEANAAFAKRVEESNSCGSDDECTVISAGCPLGCWAAVNVEHAAEAQQYAADLIAAYERGGASCAYGCVAVGAPYCDDGRCRADPLEP